MTTEQLNKGNVLKNKLDKLYKEIECWKSADSIGELVLFGNGRRSIDTQYIDFEVLKTLVLARLTKCCEEVEAEFSAL